ncbi:MAG: DUF2232 domain-containing protein [Elusimicrobiota bacterium]
MDQYADHRRRLLKLSAVSLMLVLSAQFVPAAGILLLFLSIVPQLILFFEKKYISALIVWFTVSAASVFAIGWNFSGTYVFLFLVYTIVFSFMLIKGKRPYTVILLSSVLWCSIVMVWVGYNRIFLEVNLLEQIIKLTKITGAVSIGKYYDFGLPYSQIEHMGKAFSSMIGFISRSAVGWMFITGIAGSWIVYYAASRYLPVPGLPPIILFRLPESYVWVMIAALILFMAGRNYTENNMAVLLASNTGVVILGGYFLSGLGVVAFFMARWRISFFFRSAVMVFLLIFLRGMYLFIIFGIMDVWMNFRNKWRISRKGDIE